MESLSQFMIENYNAIITQPQSIEHTIKKVRKQIRENIAQIPTDINKIYLTGYGDSLCISKIAKFWFEEFLNIATTDAYPIDFHYASSNLLKDSIVIGISASGQTMQTLDAIRKVKGTAYVIGLTNFSESSLSYLSDLSLITDVEKPFGYSPSKTTITALITLNLLSLELSFKWGKISEDIYKNTLEEIKKIPNNLTNIIKRHEDFIIKLAQDTSNYQYYYILGSGPNLGSALLGEAKIKEYSAAMAQGVELEEFAHYHILAVDDKSVVIMLKPASTEILRFNEIKIGLNKLEIPYYIINENTMENLNTDVYINLVLLQLFAHYLTRAKKLNPKDFKKPHAYTIKLVE
jgi:glucosamine--fructose-6-phosphate aminotransferase (isomerizing)